MSVNGSVTSPEPFRTVYRLRVLLMGPPLYVMAFCRWHEYENDLVLYTVGPAIFLVGVLIRIWGHMHLRYRLKAKTTLTTTGPYARMRNPLYIGNTVIMAGICFMSELIWFVPVVVVYCGVLYSLVVRYEEAHLTSKYGETYVDYLRTVPRWIPRVRPTTVEGAPCAREFLWASVLAETRNFLFLAIPILKEVIGPL